MSCRARNAEGEPCGAWQMVDEDGLCPAHRAGGLERMRVIGVKGGVVTAQKHASGGFRDEELPALVSLEDAKARLDLIQKGILTRRITHAEGASAAKAIAEWCKAESQAATARLVNELTKELEAKTKEIEELRRQLAAPSRVRAV